MVDVAQYTNEVKRDSEHLVIIQKARVRRRRYEVYSSHTIISQLFQCKILSDFNHFKSIMTGKDCRFKSTKWK